MRRVSRDANATLCISLCNPSEWLLFVRSFAVSTRVLHDYMLSPVAGSGAGEGQEIMKVVVIKPKPKEKRDYHKGVKRQKNMTTIILLNIFHDELMYYSMMFWCSLVLVLYLTLQC